MRSLKKKLSNGPVEKVRLWEVHFLVFLLKRFLAFLTTYPPCVDIFYGINVDKKWTFLTTYLPRLVNVACECPLKIKVTQTNYVSRNQLHSTLSFENNHHNACWCVQCTYWIQLVSIFYRSVDFIIFQWTSRNLRLQIMNVIHIWSPLTNNTVVPIIAIFSVESTSSHGPIKWIKFFRTCLSIFQKLNASGV